MSKPWKHTPQTIRRPSVGLPVLWCLLASALAGVVVYRWGRERWTPVEAGLAYTATAYVVEQPVGCVKRTDDQRSATVPDGAFHAPYATDTARVPFTASDDDAERAAEAANHLAESDVSRRRAQWQHSTEGASAKAREATETARRRLAQCEANLDTFRRELAEAAAKPQVDAKPQADATPQAVVKPPMIDNPRWIALQRELSELRQRREDLLVKRTPQHPAVQDVTRQIAGAEEQLAATERQIPGPQREAPRAKDTPLLLGASEARHAERDEYNKDEHNKGEAAQRGNQERLDALSAAAAAARRDCQQAELAQQQAVRDQAAGPELAVEPAQVVPNPAPVDYGWWRLLLTSLCSGLVMAFGAGSLAVASGIESPEGSIAEVQADLGEPLIGIIPADDPARAAARVNHQRRFRRVAVAVGLLLIAACPLVAFWGVLGIS